MAFKIVRSSPEEIKKIQALERIKIPSVNLDILSIVFFGEDYDVNEFIHLHNPTFKEVKEFGEMKYLHLVSLITMRSYDDCVALDDKGLNYQEISDFDIFIRNTRKLTPEDSRIIFGSLDFSKFTIEFSEETQTHYLKCVLNDYQTIIIDKNTYAYIVAFVRKINFVSEKIEYDMGNEIGRKFLLERKRRKQELAKKSKQDNTQVKSQLANIASFCCAHSGGKYNYQTIQYIKISQLYDEYKRLNFIDERNDFSAALRTGMMKDADVHKGAYKLDAARNLYE